MRTSDITQAFSADAVKVEFRNVYTQCMRQATEAAVKLAVPAPWAESLVNGQVPEGAESIILHAPDADAIERTTSLQGLAQLARRVAVAERAFRKATEKFGEAVPRFARACRTVHAAHAEAVQTAGERELLAALAQAKAAGITTESMLAAAKAAQATAARPVQNAGGASK
jgi:hypothetical protein